MPRKPFAKARRSRLATSGVMISLGPRIGIRLPPLLVLPPLCNANGGGVLDPPARLPPVPVPATGADAAATSFGEAFVKLLLLSILLLILEGVEPLRPPFSCSLLALLL